MNYYFSKKKKSPLPIWPCTFPGNFTPRGANPKKKKIKIRNQKTKSKKTFYFGWSTRISEPKLTSKKKIKNVVLKFLLYSIFSLFFFTVASHLVGPQLGPPVSSLLGSSGPKKEKPQRSNL